MRRAVRGNRPYAGDPTVQGSTRAGFRGLHPDASGQHGDGGSRRLCRRRRQGQDLSPGGHGGRHGLYGCPGSGPFSRHNRCQGRHSQGRQGQGWGGKRRRGMMDWDKLRIFHAVAEAGSFTHAGEALNLSQSAVSRQISALEESVSVPLFHRHARGLILTEQGELLYRTAHEVFAKLAMAEAQLSESKDRPKGQLKVTTTVALGSTWLTPRMGEFLEVYPDVAVDLLLDDRELDLSMREADVAIRMAPPRQPELIQRHLMTVHMHVY